MKKILFLLIIASFLLACGIQNQNNTQTGVTQESSTESEQKDIPSGKEVEETEKKIETQKEDSIENTSSHDNRIISAYYLLRDTNENGEILDGNMDEKGNPKEGLEPLKMPLMNLIPGFQKAVKDMKPGETKSFTVSPEDGYGTDMVVVDMPYEDLAPVFSITEDIKILEGKMIQERKIAELPKEFIKEYLDGKEEGDIVSDEQGTIVKLVKKTNDTATFEMLNTNSPFYEKEIKEGTTAKTTDPISHKEMAFTITKVEGDKVTLEIQNGTSPFAGKDFKVGASGEGEENGKKILYKILKINEEGTQKTVTIERTNTHHLANKTLYFTVKLESISPAPKMEIPMMDTMEDKKTSTEK